MRDFRSALESRQFTDPQGTPLETCQDYIDLLESHRLLLAACTLAMEKSGVIMDASQQEALEKKLSEAIS